MTNPSKTTVDHIIALYKEFLGDPSFESYESFENELDVLFDELRLQVPGNIDHKKLLKVKELHDQVISIILLEKESLGKKISAFNQKKHATNQYGKVSSYDGMDAFFLDFKK